MPIPRTIKNDAAFMNAALEAGEGILRLAPTWVPRSHFGAGGDESLGLDFFRRPLDRTVTDGSSNMVTEIPVESSAPAAAPVDVAKRLQELGFPAPTVPMPDLTQWQTPAPPPHQWLRPSSTTGELRDVRR